MTGNWLVALVWSRFICGRGNANSRTSSLSFRKVFELTMKAFRCSRVVLFEGSKGYQSSLKAAGTVVLLVTAHKNSEKWRGFQVEDDGIEECAAKVQRDTDTVH